MALNELPHDSLAQVARWLVFPDPSAGNAARVCSDGWRAMNGLVCATSKSLRTVQQRGWWAKVVERARFLYWCAHCSVWIRGWVFGETLAWHDLASVRCQAARHPQRYAGTVVMNGICTRCVIKCGACAIVLCRACYNGQACVGRVWCRCALPYCNWVCYERRRCRCTGQ